MINKVRRFAFVSDACVASRASRFLLSRIRRKIICVLPQPHDIGDNAAVTLTAASATSGVIGAPQAKEAPSTT